MKRKPIYFIIITVILIAFCIGLWYRSSRYAIAFFMPTDDGTEKQNIILFRGIYEIWQLGLQDAKAKSLITETFEEIPEDIDTSMPILKQKIKKFLDQHPQWLWDDKKIIIIPGFTSKQLEAGKNAILEAGRKIICMSPDSTTPLAATWPHTLQMVQNDTFSAKAIAMFARRKGYEKIIILYQNEPYSKPYKIALTQELNQQKIQNMALEFNREQTETLVTKKINPSLQNESRPAVIFAGNADELIPLEKILAPHIELICTDMCADLGDIFPPQRVITVVVPAINDYTPTTKNIYQRIFEILEKKIPHFNYTVSNAVPFVYDCAHHIGNLIKNKFDFSWRYLTMATDAAHAPAALASTWYTEKQHGPANGGYWFIYTHDPKTKDITSYRKLINGNTYTLPQSAAVAYQIGNYVWAGSLEWNMYQNIWEEYALNEKIIGTKLSYINYQTTTGGIINWSPIHIKKYRDAQNVWWFGNNIEDSYPLTEQKYKLN